MIERAVAAGLPFAWFTADETYGDNGPLRECLEDSELAVSCDHRVPAGAGQVIYAGAKRSRVAAITGAGACEVADWPPCQTGCWPRARAMAAVSWYSRQATRSSPSRAREHSYEWSATAR